MLSQEVFEAHLIERHGLEVHKRVKERTIGIAGLGGLGSHIALALARLGVGKLVLVDFDYVELSNVNRQAYFIQHIGQLKTEAMVALIREVNPFIEIETHQAYVDRENALSFFGEVDFMVEAFDNPLSKAAISEVILYQTKIPLVAASGMAGAYSSNTIKTKQLRSGFYLCGDGVTDSRKGQGLMAPRVMVAAGHQANMILRLIIGETRI